MHERDGQTDGHRATAKTATLQRTKHFAVPSVGGATRFANLWWKFCKT